MRFDDGDLPPRFVSHHARPAAAAAAPTFVRPSDSRSTRIHPFFRVDESIGDTLATIVVVLVAVFVVF